MTDDQPPVPDEPFYRPLDGLDGARFHATAATTGPWFADAQHVGPPSALLFRSLERLVAATERPPGSFARLTAEVLGPVPAGEVTVGAQVERGGRSVELYAAELVAGGRAALRLRAWRVAAGDTAAVAGHGGRPAQALAPPAAGTRQTARPDGWLPGFIDAMEWRWLTGGLDVAGPGTAWARPLVALVEGEESSALQRLALLADSANGVAAPLDIRSWLFVNTELTVHLHRDPTGPWTGADAHTTVGPAGAGTVSAVLHDLDGPVGRATQALLIRPR